MLTVWLLYLIEILFSFFAKQTFSGNEFLIQIIVIVVTTAVCFVEILKLPKHIVMPIVISFAISIAGVFFDHYTMLLSDFSSDVAGYYEYGVRCMENLSDTGVYGVYSQFLGILFRFTGPSILIAAYTNSLLGVTTKYIFFKCMHTMRIEIKQQEFFMWVFSLFPYSLYNSMVAYREQMIITFLMLSLLFLLKWINESEVRNQILSFAFLLCASVFHAGVILVGIGYGIVFAFYSPMRKRMLFKKSTIKFLIGILAAIILIVFANPDLFLTKFLGAMNDESAIISKFNMSTGSSSYLTWIDATSIFQVIIFSPLKILYFWVSPVPFDWRGIGDVITFCIDSFTYIATWVFLLKNIRKGTNKSLLLALLIGVFLSSVAFGIGTWNAGTAMRHRNKLFGILMVLAAILRSDLSKIKTGKKNLK